MPFNPPHARASLDDLGNLLEQIRDGIERDSELIEKILAAVREQPCTLQKTPYDFSEHYHEMRKEMLANGLEHYCDELKQKFGFKTESSRQWPKPRVAIGQRREADDVLIWNRAENRWFLSKLITDGSIWMPLPPAPDFEDRMAAEHERKFVAELMAEQIRNSPEVKETCKEAANQDKIEAIKQDLIASGINSYVAQVMAENRVKQAMKADKPEARSKEDIAAYEQDLIKMGTSPAEAAIIAEQWGQGFEKDLSNVK